MEHIVLAALINVNAFNQWYIFFSKQEGMLSGKQVYWYKDNILERRVAQVVLNSLLYLHDLKMKFVNIYKDLVRGLYIYIYAIHILSTGYLQITLILHQLNEMLMQVKEAVLEIKLIMILSSKAYNYIMIWNK